MTLDPNLAAIRFGTGRSPRIPDPPGADAMLAALAGPDRMAAAYPIPAFTSLFPAIAEIKQVNDRRRAGTASEADLDRKSTLRRELQARQWDLTRQTLARGLDTDDGLRERLTWFWADHFTVLGKSTDTRAGVSIFAEEAIRPHVAGRFSDMLRAVVKHPMMLLYLDQSASVGPNSAFARTRPARGLNENLAREVLELHTLGVGGSYGQDDVRELAELFAGLTGNAINGFSFNENRGEPGPETVLGRNYGRRKPKLEDVEQVLDDLAVHPDTARHIARKLAVHFVSDQPDAELVAALEAAFLETGGDLGAVTGTLLAHPSATQPRLQKAKQPTDFIVSSLRALGMTGQEMAEMDPKAFKRLVLRPLEMMGQPWQNPSGPDGWPEEAEAWITPQGLAVRITWAMGLQRHFGGDMPDPRAFVATALGDMASEQLVFAAGAAETRGDGVGIVLASPEFQRR
ncbi:DUF1800 domain-containing protein [Tropicimonas aquimaris]|uniref:DUF1800 family protein n=1 Tax=Tropicimonas aquimaris TaxID=914152 RepID=A0ABW3IM26_9RHOB